MKKTFIASLIALSALLVGTEIGWSQQSDVVLESPTLTTVAKNVADGRRTSVEEFWAAVEKQKTPIIENIPDDEKHVLATFVWKGTGDVKDVVLMAQPNGITMFRDQRSHLLRLANTNIWYRSVRLPLDAEFTYMFSVNPPETTGNGSMPVARPATHSDPLNPLQYQIPSGSARSVARMPGTPENPWIQKNNVPSGQLEEHTINSAILKKKNTRQLWVYITPGPLQNPNLLILLDSRVYTKFIPTPLILDNLFAAHKIGPTIAIFVDDGSGDTWQTDMYFSEPFIRFLTDEVLPWAQQEYKFKADPKRTVIGGDSIAGMTSVFTALRRPDVFGKVLSQDGSFWINNREADEGEPEWLARQFAQTPKINVYFYIEVGQMEFVPNESDRMFSPFIPGITNLLASNRHLRDVLKAKGYRFHYSELYADHELIHWQRALPEALMATLGDS